jgi:5-methylcytosine-specific restriction endonuclease McrA
MRGLPLRPGRRMPTWQAIQRYWYRQERGWVGFGQCDPGEPTCYRCGWWCMRDDKRSEADGLERAHLVDRCFGGLDIEPNLVLLCSTCHRSMPSFEPGDEHKAIEWVETGTYWMTEVMEEAQHAADALDMFIETNNRTKADAA